jgi:hypothetical protein
MPRRRSRLCQAVVRQRALEAGWSVIVTEVFSLDQATAACELYLQVTALQASDLGSS